MYTFHIPPSQKNKIVNTTVPIFNLAARAHCNILEFDLKRNHCTFVQYLTTERWNSVPIFRSLVLSNNAESRMFHCSKVCIGKSFPRENFCPNLMPSPSFEVYDIAADAHALESFGEFWNDQSFKLFICFYVLLLARIIVENQGLWISHEM